MHAAAMRGDTQTCIALLSQGANVNAHAVSGNTPLHFAVVSGNNQTEICLVLLSHNANVNANNNEGNTPLHGAILFRHFDTSIALIQHGADTKLYNNDAETPLYLAKKKLSPQDFIYFQQTIQDQILIKYASS